MTALIEEVPYFRLTREAGRVPSLSKRTLTMALRWWPKARETEAGATAISTLRRFAEGDEISQRHLDGLLNYLAAASVEYATSGYEPYPGRNAEAVDNLDEAIDLLLGVT